MSVFSPDMVEGVSNKLGQKLRDVIAEKVRTNRRCENNITQEWFNDVFEDFGLSQQIATKLPEPDDDEPCDERLLRAF